ncbi:hypothetical protein ES332_A08G246300v1 [Gossypium tomentosum]|uniref:Microtubule-binding protein TANGLED n=1 Tax=Gossypium tomentosum TaxID=34277 RepID=A0A5D2PK26_GOSTO|nr:hypothetical protein ES332_A08G246300v1 [Gossypium tomentosum]
MVARTPPKQRKFVVEKCMARLQELQLTVAGGSKVISGVSLSPRSTRGYMRTSLRCKQESLRIKNFTPRKSPVGKYPATAGAMLVGETVGEILQANQFARQTLAANKLQLIRTESDSPSLQRARSRINFKVSSRNRPWAKKTVLFPNPLFSSAPTSQQQKNRQTPHKFLIKSPPSASKFQVKIKSLPVVSLSPTRSTNTSKKSPKPRLMSPLKSRISLRESDAPMSGLKQRQLMSVRSSTSRV